MHIQKYVHDMSAWRSLTVEEQEKVIGRSKLEDIEMTSDVKPANSHVALNAIKDENGKAYAYRDAAGNYYEMNFGLTF